MKNTLSQKAFPFNSIRYELTEQGLSVSNRSLFKKETYFLKFEEIGIKRMNMRKWQPRNVMASVLLIFVTILMYVQEQVGAGNKRTHFGRADSKNAKLPHLQHRSEFGRPKSGAIKSERAGVGGY